MQRSTNLRLRTQHAHGIPQSPPLKRRPRKKCRAPGCNRTFANRSGRTQHENACHPDYIAQPSSDPVDAPPRMPSLFQESESEENSERNDNDRHRVTVEDVEDEDYMSSSSEPASRGKTTRHHHSVLNGAYN